MNPSEQKYWDQIASSPDYLKDLHKKPAEQIEEDIWLRGLTNRLPRLDGKVVLDCGTGMGKLAGYLAQCNAKVIGFDISKNMCHLAKTYFQTHNLEGNFVCCSFENLPFADNSIDIAVGQFIIHHTKLEQSIKDLERVMKPGGVAYFIENVGVNPLIRWYIKSTHFKKGILRRGSPGEKPLLPEDLKVIQSFVKHLKTHIDSFVFFEILFDRIPIVPRKVGKFIDDFIFLTLRWLLPLKKWSYFLLLELRF